jgi:hypothetical protein
MTKTVSPLIALLHLDPSLAQTARSQKHQFFEPRAPTFVRLYPLAWKLKQDKIARFF